MRARARGGIVLATRADEIAVPERRSWPWPLVAMLVGVSGCAGELTAFAALAFSMTLGAWIMGRDRQRRALYEAEHLRHAIATGQHRGLEDHLRKQLMLVAAGEAVSPERRLSHSNAENDGAASMKWAADLE